MPRLSIAQLRVGASVTKQAYLLRDKSVTTTRTGGAMLRVTLADRTGTIPGVLFDVPAYVVDSLVVGRGVLVTVFGPNPDGEGTLLRLWEHGGQAGPCTVTLPEGLVAAAVRPVDLRGRPTGPPTPVEHGTFTQELKAFAPASLLLEPARRP